jgi:hypothetical protein
MANATNHHQTKSMLIPYADIGLSPRSKRAVPVEVIYSLKKQAKIDILTEAEADFEQPNASKGSMFFRGKARDIASDPFLQRLSRLK